MSLKRAKQTPKTKTASSESIPASPLLVDNSPQRALFLAVILDDIEAARRAVDAGAAPEEKVLFPPAACNSSLDLKQFRIWYRDSRRYPIQHFACHHHSMFERARGSYRCSAMMAAVSLERYGIVTMFVEEHQSPVPPRMAYARDPEVVRWALGRGLPPTEAVTGAIESDRPEILEILVKAGASLSGRVRYSEVFKTDTLLEFARSRKPTPRRTVAWLREHLDDAVLDEPPVAEQFARAVSAGHLESEMAGAYLLWRGLAEDGRPGAWIVKLVNGGYAILLRTGKRWSYQTGRRDAILALVPHRQLEQAARVVSAREAGGIRRA